MVATRELHSPRAALVDEPSPRSYPGARRPDRHRVINATGPELAVWEWGDPDAPPVLFAHGGFDFTGTFDLLAPLVADAGWRVVCWDQRGHGDSSKGHLYSWAADLRDTVAVIDSIGVRSLPVVGHSKGGALMLQLADALPHRVTRLVNLDGLPSERSWPDVPDHHRTRMANGELTAWLDHRREAATKVRRPGTIEELAERRGRMNPRLDPKWLEYVVPIGGFEQDDGWRWKIDPSMRLGGFGPWRPEWSMSLLPSLAMPALCVLGMDVELMGWGTLTEDVEGHLPPNGRLVPLEGVGHFMHVEQPGTIAELILEHLR
ncbi:MAG: alpha/beta hydrolase [Aquihabitans sp.]